MHNLEVMNMAISKTRALDHDPRRLEMRRHQREALARPVENVREPLGEPRSRWHRIVDLLRAKRRQRAPRAARGGEFAAEQS